MRNQEDDALFAEMVAIFEYGKEYGVDCPEDRARDVLSRDGACRTSTVEQLTLCIVHATRVGGSARCIRALALRIHAMHSHELYKAKRDAELEVRSKLQKLVNSI